MTAAKVNRNKKKLYKDNPDKKGQSTYAPENRHPILNILLSAHLYPRRDATEHRHLLPTRNTQHISKHLTNICRDVNITAGAKSSKKPTNPSNLSTTCRAWKASKEAKVLVLDDFIICNFVWYISGYSLRGSGALG